MKKRKTLFIILISVIGILFAADIVISLFLVNFAVGRKDSYVPQPEQAVSDDIRKRIETNSALLAEKTAEWLSDTPAEQVSITASDGETMKADLISPPEDSHNWVILLHGYSRNRERVYNYARFYAEKGFGLLMPDMRGHGESGGNYVGMGWLDRNDVLLWIDMILSRDTGAQIVLHGVSMGAAAAMMTAGENMPGNVIAVIEDCGYTSVWDIFSDVMWDNAGATEFPLLYTSSLFSKLLAGYDFKEASALEQIKKTVTPVLFIHGSDDSFVHTEMIYDLYDVCPTKKEMYIAEGASHGMAMYIDPEVYFERVFGFLAKLETAQNSSP